MLRPFLSISNEQKFARENSHLIQASSRGGGAKRKRAEKKSVLEVVLGSLRDTLVVMSDQHDNRTNELRHVLIRALTRQYWEENDRTDLPSLAAVAEEIGMKTRRFCVGGH